MPSQSDMERKAAGGATLLHDVNRIIPEFTTHANYSTDADLENVVSRNQEVIKNMGYQLVDASHLFDGIKNGLLLLERWAVCVHTARTSKQMILMRRTPANCGAMLVIQRLEHLRGMVSEMSPLAFAVLVRDDQMLVTRDQVGDIQSIDSKLAHMAQTEELCFLCKIFTRARVSTVLPCGHVLHSDCYRQHLDDSNTCPVCYSSVGDVKPVELELTEELKKFQNLNMEKEYNMPTPLFTQEISLLRNLRDSNLCNENAGSDSKSAEDSIEEGTEEGIEEGVEGVEGVVVKDATALLVGEKFEEEELVDCLEKVNLASDDP